MAVKAFVLIEVTAGKSKKVIADLAGIQQQLKEIQSVDMVTGPYDIIAVLEAEDLNSIGGMVTNKVHPIPGVNRTVTCLAIKVN